MEYTRATVKRPMHIAACCVVLAVAQLMAACSTAPRRVEYPFAHLVPQPVTDKGNEVAMFSLGLVDIGYTFGGKTPEAGLDCSGMVSFVFQKSVNMKITGSAADIARRGEEVEPRNVRPGDLIFFNTLDRPFSHVGIYIGDGRFVHAPNSRGKVRIDRLDNRYYASHYEMTRRYFD